MGILDKLYKSNPKDIASGGSDVIRRFTRVSQTFTGTAASIGLADNELLAPDIVRMVQWMYLETQMNTGEFCVSCSAQLDEMNDAGTLASQLTRLGWSAPHTTVVTPFMYFGGSGLSVLQFPRDRWTFTANFNAAVTSKQLIAYWGGVEFPRGSLQR